MREVKCDNCGEEIEKWPSEIGDNNYCSRECAIKDREAKTKKEIHCDNCGEKMIKFEADINDTHNFCSRECAQQFRIQESYEAISCDNCGKKIERKKSDIRDTHNFCSLECSHEFQRTGQEIVGCSQCGKKIKRWPHQIKNQENFFCSKECEGEWLSENLVGKNHHNYTGKVKVECTVCGKDIEVYPYRLKETEDFLCSDECYLEWKSGPNGPVKGRTNSHFFYGLNWYKQREKVLERDNHRCQVCGATKDDAQLHCHHIIKYREYRYKLFKGNPIRNSIVEFDWKKANRMENLITVCNKCHPKIEGKEKDDIVNS